MKSQLGPPPEECFPEIELVALFNQNILLVGIFGSFFILILLVLVVPNGWTVYCGGISRDWHA